MITWLELLKLPVHTAPDWSHQRQNGMGLRNRGGTGRILEVLSDRVWRTADQIAELVEMPRKQVASNLKRMKERGDLLCRPSAHVNRFHPSGHHYILEWNRP